jgi:hypothetical protein
MNEPSRPSQPQPASQMGQYFKESGKMSFRPDSPYSHGAYLLQDDGEDFFTFQSLINKRVLLAFIETSELMAYYQTDIELLMQMFDQARREPALRYPFLVQYNSWIGELSITRAKEGMERKLQANAGGGYQPGHLSGMDLPADNLNKEEKNIFAKLFGLGKKNNNQNQNQQQQR